MEIISFRFQDFLSAFIILFAVIDITGLTPIIIDMKQKGQNIIAWKAARILPNPYRALNDSRVVKEPAPAIKGKTIGTIDAAPSGPSFLKISTPSNISMAIFWNVL